MDLENKLKKFVMSVLLGASVLFGGCERDNIKQINTLSNYTLENAVKIDLKDGLQMPGSLSNYNYALSNKKAKSLLLESGEIVFCQNPTFKGPPITDFGIKPGIYKLNSELLSVDTLYNFSNLYLTDFKSDWTEDSNEGLRPKGLLLNTLILPDSSFLFSSNLSNKLFRVYSDSSGYNGEIYLQDDNLLGISDMIYASDGKIYATQQKIVGNENNVLPRDKRVISINPLDSTINEEFLIPQLNEPIYFSSQGVSLGSKLDLLENIVENMNLNDPRFYVSDELAGVIYQVSRSNEITPLVSDLNLPSSLAIEGNGKILTLTGPKMSSNFSEFVKSPEVLEIIQSNGKYSSIYTFENEFVEDYKTGISVSDSMGYQLPLEFYMSTMLFEGTASKLNLLSSVGLTLYYTKSLTGEIGMITFEKKLEEE